MIRALGILGIVCAMAGGVLADARHKTRPPNIVFFLADDLGQRDLGCYGSTFYETPHLDRMAREGARFTRAYTRLSGLFAHPGKPSHGEVSATNGHHRLHRRSAAAPMEAQYSPSSGALCRPPGPPGNHAGRSLQRSGLQDILCGQVASGTRIPLARKSRLRFQLRRNRPGRPLRRQ